MAEHGEHGVPHMTVIAVFDRHYGMEPGAACRRNAYVAHVDDSYAPQLLQHRRRTAHRAYRCRFVRRPTLQRSVEDWIAPVRYLLHLNVEAVFHAAAHEAQELAEGPFLFGPEFIDRHLA